MSSMCLKPQCIFYLRWTWADRSLAWFPPRTCWDCCIGWWPGPTAELRGDTSNELLSKAECYQLLVLIVDIMSYIKWRWCSGDMWRVCHPTIRSHVSFDVSYLISAIMSLCVNFEWLHDDNSCECYLSLVSFSLSFWLRKQPYKS